MMKHFKIKLHHLILFALSVLLVIISLIVYLNCKSQISDLAHQQFAKRWSKEGGFSQVSVFYPQGKGFTAEDIMAIRSKSDAALTAASVEGSYEDRTWLDTYCVSTGYTLTTDTGKTSTNTVTAVGGDFFLFHPLPLVAGAYFSENDLMHDRVVIDELTAWYLFGSNNCVGLTLYINGLPYLVSGIVSGDAGDADTLAAGKTPRAYISFDAMPEGTAADCYEALMPNQIPGFALDLVVKSLGADEKNEIIVENTNRFTVERVYKVLKDLPTRSMQSLPVVFPYWENAARLTETRLAFSYLAILVLLLFPAACLIVLIVRLWRGRKWRFTGVFHFVSDWIYAARCAHANRKKTRKVRKSHEKTVIPDQPAADPEHDRELSRLP